MTNTLIRLGVRLALVLAAVALLALVLYALLFTALAAQIKAFLTLLAVHVLDLPPGVTDVAAWTIAVVAAGPVIWFGVKFLTGRVGAWQIGLVAGCVALAVAAIRVAIADWSFYKGQPIVFICPAIIPGGLPRPRYSPFDPQLGTPCPPATRETAATLLSLRRGLVPKPLQIDSLAEFDLLQLFDTRSGLPLVFQGASHPGQPPRLYEGAGYDPIAPESLLALMTRERIAAVRAFFADLDRKREEKKRLAREAGERKAKAEAEALAAVERAKRQREESEAATRRALALEQERARQEEARARVQAEQRRQREAELRLEEVKAQNLRDGANAQRLVEQSKQQASVVRPKGPPTAIQLEPTITAMSVGSVTKCHTGWIRCPPRGVTCRITCPMPHTAPVGIPCQCSIGTFGPFEGITQ